MRLLIVSGLVFGVLASLLIRWGNPANMGFCIAYFIRNISGALGLHRSFPKKQGKIRTKGVF
jgi:hypothetical protein